MLVEEAEFVMEKDVAVGDGGCWGREDMCCLKMCSS